MFSERVAADPAAADSLSTNDTMKSLTRAAWTNVKSPCKRTTSTPKLPSSFGAEWMYGRVS